MTDDRLDISPETVKALILSQFPDWGGLEITPVRPGGWDNRTFRLGTKMGIRMPSAERYAANISKEATWLPKLAQALPYTVPKPLAVGTPGAGYPFQWMVFAWRDGATLDEGDPTLRQDAVLAEALAAALLTLQAVPTDGAPPAGAQNFHRGGDLGAYDTETRDLIATLNEPQRQAAKTIWDRARASHWDAPGLWLHGDMSEGNILMQAGRFAGLLDFGLCGVGDPSSDLVPYWTIFEGAARAAFRDRLDLDEATWERAAGGALWKAR